MQLFSLAKHYTEGMIFQRDRDILIQGEAFAPCEISASLGDDTASISAEAGLFSIKLPPRKADCGLVLTVKAISGDTEQITEFTEIYIGEVWFASGQSNMQWPLHDTDEYRQNPVFKPNSDLRFYTVARNNVACPNAVGENYNWVFQKDYGWVGCDEENAINFSAVGYHFAHTLHEALGVPIGIISCNVGGSSIFSWIPQEAATQEIAHIWENYEKTMTNTDTAKSQAEFQAFLDEHAKTHDIANNVVGTSGEIPTVYYDKPGLYHFQNPSILYHAMLERISTFPARGMLWYQGESEGWSVEGKNYAAALESLVNNMKFRQDNPDFAFNFVQIAPYHDPTATNWARVNDQMRRFSLHHPDYGMITTGDVGCPKDIHPQRKQPVGERLAYAAMHKSYDLPHEYTGPIAESAIRWGDEIRISFIHATDLHQRHMNPGRFELVYEDGNIKEAIPEIRDNAIYLPLQEGLTPEYVRYEFVTCAEIGLYNKYGYPASQFELKVE